MTSFDSVWGFGAPRQILFGRGALNRLTESLQRYRFQRILLVADPGLHRAGHIQKLLKGFATIESAHCCFDHIEPEPSVETPVRAAAAWNQSPLAPHPPDVVIAMGGGSSIDVAKMTAVLLKFGGHPSDYFGFDRVPGPPVPLIAIPTTAGTGSEASHSSVLTDHEAGIKVSTLSAYLRPMMAVVDPSLTDSCPPRVTADSGIDALVHAIEAYTARDCALMGDVPHEARAYEGSHPLGRLLAAQASQLIHRHLASAVNDGSAHESRDAMALAALYAGMAFSNCGVALVHALEYPIGALVHCSHGAGNGLLLPYVMQFNLPAASRRMAELASMIGAPAGDDETQAQWLIDEVIALRKAIGIPNRLRELNVPRDALPMIAEKASRIERLITLNPRRATPDDLLQILESAY